jgi:tRNA-2-methylthio-N6-dimethylallyladenosine synthase
MDKENFSAKLIPTNESQYNKPVDTPPFVKLLKRIGKIKGIEKITFFTSNPWDFWDELIDEIALNPKIDRFIHLPVQSGSNRILKLMNRGYTRESYLSLIKRIKAKVPDAVFGTDIIVGFPGETDADFQDTLDLIKKVEFKVAFVARYSPRPGTASFKLYPDDIPAKIKKERWEVLDQIANKNNLADRPLIP